MPDPYIEKGRLLTLTTPLGEDKLLIESFSGTEAVSQLFRFQLELLSADGNIDFSQMIGKKVTFGIHLFEETKQRVFNGHVCRFSQLPSERRLARYRAEVVPWLWFLTRTADCRIFQNKSVPDIVQALFSEYGFTDFELNLQGSYEPWEYCVQYRETAFQFISRLLEQEGIFYFFKHEPNRHVLVLADSPSAHKPCPDQPMARWEHSLGPGFTRHEDAIHSWNVDKEIRPGKWALTDYNFETPMTDLLASVNTAIELGDNTRYEVFDYPGEYEKRNQGDACAKKRMELEEAAHVSITGESECRAFIAGYRFELADYDRRDQNGQYVLLSVTHSARETAQFHSGREEQGVRYSNTFTALPYSVRFRPPRLTPKSTVAGPQTAVVVGPSGEEIYTDKYGRVKVHFHWDRKGTSDEKASCWIRVSQPWAGKGWGAVNIPRIGQEVVVDFLEGDPDRPLITGRVYNAVEMPPYALPANQTMTAFKSLSSKSGGGFNELRFEDKKDHEQIFIYGQRDEDIRINNDAREYIGNDRHLIVKRDRFENIERDAHLKIERDVFAEYGNDHHLHVKGKQALKVGADQHVTVGNNLEQKIGTKCAAEAGMEIHLKAGMNVVIEAGAQLSLKVGGNFVDLNPAGVFISGTLVNINSGGAAGSGSGASPGAPTAPTDAKEADTARPGSVDVRRS